MTDLEIARIHAAREIIGETKSKQRERQAIMEGERDHTPLVRHHLAEAQLARAPEVIYGDSDDVELTDAEFENMVDLGQSIAGFLQSEHAQGDYSVDTGCGGGEYEAFIKMGDVEYKVSVRPYVRASEIEADLAEITSP